MFSAALSRTDIHGYILADEKTDAMAPIDGVWPDVEILCRGGGCLPVAGHIELGGLAIQRGGSIGKVPFHTRLRALGDAQ
jgi:hypothetical protein